MNDTPSSHSHWKIVISGVALVLLVTLGSLLALRDQLRAEWASNIEGVMGDQRALEKKLVTLQSSVDAASSHIAPDIKNLEALQQASTDLSEKLTLLTERIETLEKNSAALKPHSPAITATPAPVSAPAPTVTVAPPPAPEAVPVTASTETRAHPSTTLRLRLAATSGRPYAEELGVWMRTHPKTALDLGPLLALASSGIPSESDALRQLAKLLPNELSPSNQEVADDTSVPGKINTHLKGLVSIKKQSDVAAANPYAALRARVLTETLETLEKDVAALSDATRAPLEGWLTTAKQRRAALATLETLALESPN